MTGLFWFADMLCDWYYVGLIDILTALVWWKFLHSAIIIPSIKYCRILWYFCCLWWSILLIPLCPILSSMSCVGIFAEGMYCIYAEKFLYGGHAMHSSTNLEEDTIPHNNDCGCCYARITRHVFHQCRLSRKLSIALLYSDGMQFKVSDIYDVWWKIKCYKDHQQIPTVSNGRSTLDTFIWPTGRVHMGSQNNSVLRN